MCLKTPDQKRKTFKIQSVLAVTLQVKKANEKQIHSSLWISLKLPVADNFMKIMLMLLCSSQVAIDNYRSCQMYVFRF